RHDEEVETSGRRVDEAYPGMSRDATKRIRDAHPVEASDRAEDHECRALAAGEIHLLSSEENGRIAGGRDPDVEVRDCVGRHDAVVGHRSFGETGDERPREVPLDVHVEAAAVRSDVRESELRLDPSIE